MSLYHKGSANLGQLRLLLLDVDGVLTDGCLWMLPTGDELKMFSVHDGLGIRLAQRAGLEVAFLSGRKSAATRRRASELGVDTVIEGSRDKLKDFESLLKRLKLEPRVVAFMGDDLTDLPVLRRVGFAAAPDNAADEVKYVAHYVSRNRGGRGAVREVVNLILKADGRWSEIVAETEDMAAG